MNIINKYLKDINYNKKFFSDDDIEEAMEWPNDIIIKILMRLGEIEDYGHINPWCIVNEIKVSDYSRDFKCNKCNWGKRHIQCGYSNSIYRKVLNGGISIYQIEGVCKITKKFRQDADKLLDKLYDIVSIMEIQDYSKKETL